jgi:hypothetical protein
LLFLKNIVKRVASYLNGAGSVYDSTPLTFPSLNIEKVKKKLCLLAEAQQRGSKNLPLTSSKTPDDVEQSIVGFIAEQIRDVSESYGDYQRTFDDRINRLKATGHAERLEEIAGAAENDFEREIRQSSIEIHTAKKSVEEIEKYVDDFKLENQINRPAIYPDSYPLHFAILFFILIAETGMNGNFFARGSEFGWVGGIVTAIVPSIVNMLFAFLLGNYAVRLAVSVQWVKKFSGIIILLLLPLAIFVMNLGLAHYRTASVIGEQDAAKIALSNLLKSPFSLSDIESWLLLIIGCMCSFVAALKFWGMDDKYPGYGGIARRRDNKIFDYDDVISHAFDRLQDTRDDRLEELEVVYSQTCSKEGDAIVILDNQRRWVHRFDDYLVYLQGVGRTLISYYRNKNCEHSDVATF